MGTQEFDFATGKVVSANRYQAVIVSDCNHSSELIEEYIRSNRHKFLGKTAELRNALELVRKFKQGILFLDADTKGVDIFPLMAVLRKKVPSFKIILMTGAPTKEFLSKSQAAGATAFLVKPLNVDAVEKVIKRIK